MKFEDREMNLHLLFFSVAFQIYCVAVPCKYINLFE